MMMGLAGMEVEGLIGNGWFIGWLVGKDGLSLVGFGGESDMTLSWAGC